MVTVVYKYLVVNLKEGCDVEKFTSEIEEVCHKNANKNTDCCIQFRVEEC